LQACPPFEKSASYRSGSEEKKFNEGEARVIYKINRNPQNQGGGERAILVKDTSFPLKK